MSSFFNNFTGEPKPLHPNTTLPGRPFTAPEHKRCPARGGPSGQYACRHPEGHAGYHVAVGSDYYAWTDDRANGAKAPAPRAHAAASVGATTPRRGQWPDCPNCQQSATGQYARSIGCYRCGWVEGQ